MAAATAVFPVPNRNTVFPLRPRHPVRLFVGEIAVWSPVVVGPLLVLGGAVLIAVTEGRLSWLPVLAGAVCLATFALVRQDEVARASRRTLENTLLGNVARDAVRSKDTNSSVAAEVTGEVGKMLAQLRKELELSHDNLANEVRQTLFVDRARPPDTFQTFTQAMIAAGLWAPVSVYTSADDGEALKDAVVRVLREFGLEVAVEEPSVRGSWWQRFWARGREVAESEPVRDRLAKVERALELEGLGKRQAEIDKAKAEAVAALYAVVKEQENAVVRLGSIVMIKKAGDLVVFTVSEMQAAVLEKHSELLRDPVAALNFLHDGRLPGHGDWPLTAGPDPMSHPAVTDHDQA